MQGAMSNGGMSSPLNSVLRKTISPWYDDNPNPLAGASWPQYLKNAMVITPPRTHISPPYFGGYPIVIMPKQGGQVFMPSTLMVGPPNASVSSPNIRIGYAGNSSFEMTNAGSHLCYFGNGGNVGTRVGYAAQFTANSGGYFGFASTAAGSSLGSAETCIFRPASATIGIYNPTSTTTAQTFELYNTWTSTTSFENLRFKSTAGAAYQIGSAVGSAGGTNRAIEIGHYNSGGTFAAAFSVATTGVISVASHINLPSLGILYTRIIKSPSTDGNLILYGSDRTDSAKIIIAGASAGSDISFWADPTGEVNPAVSQVVFKRSGAVLIGTTTDNTVNTLQVAGSVSFTQAVKTTGSPTAFTLTGAAHTTLTLSTEATDVNFNLARTVQFATGALTTQRAMRIQAPTCSFVGASTITTASTLSISGPPVAGTNATVTNAYALNVESGNAYFAGNIRVAGGTSSTIGVAASSEILFGATAYITQSRSGDAYGTQHLGSTYQGSYLIRDDIAGAGFGWGATSSTIVTTPSLMIVRDASDVLAQRRGTNAQTLRVYNTYTSSTSYETLNIKGKAAANFEIGPENGSAGGTLRGLTLGGYTDGSATITPWLIFDNTGYATFTADITALNLSGNNTGDQNLSEYLTINDAGITYLSQFAFGYITLNGVSISQSQTFSATNDGDDFTIETIGTTHFFKIPDASETARGLINTGTQTIAGAKTFNDPIIETPPASVTLSTNGQFSVEMTSNTAGNLVYRGSDGTTRRAALVFV